MEKLLSCIRDCTHCKEELPLGPRPVISAHQDSKVVIIGQAPGRKVHESGIPWDDASGERLREWLDVSSKIFYSPQHFAILPMGLCYPGKAKTGDKPPMKACAPMWHDQVFDNIQRDPLILLIGKYAQDYYLPKERKRSLTDKVLHFEEFLPRFFVLPHPSPLNNIWRKKNPWFEEEVIPILKSHVKSILGNIEAN